VRRLRKIEDSLIVLGLVLLLVYLAAHLDRALFTRAALAKLRLNAQYPNALKQNEPKPDFSLWDEKRIKGYEESLSSYANPPMGVLRIPKIHLEAPIVEGTDELSLNRGVGHIVGTPEIGEEGNLGIAGHRDGFFRALKDVVPGDTVELDTGDTTWTYVIDHITVVDPTDVNVLRPRDGDSLTLVTCYPFYFIGSAPKRYIVQASMVRATADNTSGK